MTTDLPPGLTARPFTLDDLDAAFAVYSAAEFEDSGHLALEPEDIAGDWARPSFDLATDSIGVFDGDRLVGAAEVTTGGRRAEGAVLPGERGRGIGSWLAAWTEQRATALGSSRVGQVAPDGSLPQRLLRGRGYTLGHTSWVLELPEGREIAAALPPGRLHPRHRGHRRARARRPTSSSRTRSTSGRGGCAPRSRTGPRRPCAGPVRNRGSCGSSSTTGWSWGPRSRSWTARGSGYVHQLAVERTHRGQGLAQALLADAFGRARERGATRSELSTDSRTGALDLYLKVGMEVTQVWTHLVTELPR